MAGGLAALLRAVLVWTLFIAAESAQGTLRRVLLTPEMQLAARGAGVLIGSVLIVALTWATWRWLGLRRARTALAVGGLWTALTIAFDVGLGRALGASWGTIGDGYDPGRGEAMLLGLTVMALTPLAVWRLRGPGGRTLRPASGR